MWKDQSKPDSSQTIRINFADVMHSDITEQEKADLMALPNITEHEIWQMNQSFMPFIFYKKDKQGAECFCTSCNKSFFVTKDVANHLLHKSHLTCPLCDQRSTAVSASYQQKNKTKSTDFIIFKEKAKTVYAICLSVEKCYARRVWHINDPDFERQPDLYGYLRKIYVFKPGQVATYAPSYSCKYGDYVYSRVKKPISKPFPLEAFQRNLYYYCDAKILNESILKNTHLKYYAKDHPTDYFLEYLVLCSLYPIAELVYKSGDRLLHHLITDKIVNNRSHVKLCNWHAQRPKDFLKISLNEFVDFKNSGICNTEATTICIDILELYAQHKRQGKKKSFEFCVFENSLKQYERRYKEDDQLIENLDDLFEYKNRQVKAGNWKHLYLYFDYLDLARKCGYDITQKNIRYPRDIEQAHQQAVDNFNILELEKERKKAEAEAKKYNYPKRYAALCKKYAFEFNGLEIITPKTAADIILEGKRLQHCVGGYASRHIKGETIILFLRRQSEPEKSFYTIEIDEKNHKIRQCHGYQNERSNPKAPEVKAFEEEYTKFLQNPKKYNAERKEKECRKSA